MYVLFDILPNLSNDYYKQDFEDEDDKAQFGKLSSQISWFFFSLLIVGYVEEYCSGLSYRLPGGLMWSIFVEVCEN